MKRVFKLLPVFLLVMAVSLGQCFAASQTYSYTVTFFSGNQGAFKGDVTKIRISGNYNDRIVIDIDDLGLKLNNDKYYVKGLRETGKDNKDTTFTRSKLITFSEDVSYVVAYGLKKDMVKYTVKYEDKNGKDLLPSQEYYASVGDKPVVAFKYIEGYIPEAYNETKTLTSNEKDNVFIFHYEKVTKEEQAQASSGTEKKDNGKQDATKTDNEKKDKEQKNSSEKQSSKTEKGNDAVSVQTVASNANQDSANQAQAIDATYRDANDNDGNAGGTDDSGDSDNNKKPKEIKDLDDNEVPLASGSNNNKDKGVAGFFAHHQIAVISAAAVAVLAVLIVLWKRRKKANAEQ